MSDLYYYLELSNGETGKDFFSANLKFKSRHVFPSPVGTEIYFSVEDFCRDNCLEWEGDSGFFLQVIGHRDPVHRGYTLNDFQMVLKELGDPNKGGIGIESPDAEIIVRYLKSEGWEEIK